MTQWASNLACNTNNPRREISTKSSNCPIPLCRHETKRLKWDRRHDADEMRRSLSFPRKTLHIIPITEGADGWMNQTKTFSTEHLSDTMIPLVFYRMDEAHHTMQRVYVKIDSLVGWLVGLLAVTPRLSKILGARCFKLSY